ncbi:hypothetical protein [Leifsonia sp. NPDC058230]|uniref:hypothetical protein n=1 Tax=Leifsonia sp. NPDC058230 TaxID=3346391 RepID=UPI0036DF200C
MSDPKNEPIDDFDETNGLVEGLDGDDGGVIDHDPHDGVIFEALRDLDDPITDEDSAETPYSEEGRP